MIGFDEDGTLSDPTYAGTCTLMLITTLPLINYSPRRGLLSFLSVDHNNIFKNKEYLFLDICEFVHYDENNRKENKMIEYTTEKKKRLALDINIELHLEIKRRAMNRHITMTEWVLMAIMERIEQESKYE